MEWRVQSRRVTLTACMDDVRHAHNLSHDVVCARASIHVLRFMCAVWKVLWVLVVTLSLVSCVLSLGFTTHTQYQV